MTADELDWDMDSLEGRKEAVRHFVREHDQLSIPVSDRDRPDELPEMYDDHRTQAEVDLTCRYIDAGVLPQTLDRRDSRGPVDLSFYGIKCHIEEWQRVLDLDREGLEERLEEIRGMDNPYKNHRYSDGSSGQWRAWNNSIKGAVLWLLGEHKEQQDQQMEEA